MKARIILFFLVVAAGNLVAQSDETEPGKRFEHYLEVQANPILRQIITFGEEPAVNNPYWLNYVFNSTQSGWGGRAGFGIDFQSLKDNDGIVDRKSNITSVAARIGVDRRHVLAPRWQAGYGFDAVYELNDNSTVTQLVSFDTITTDTRIETKLTGGGFRGYLRYSISPRVWIGTEANLYYRFGINSTTTKITSTVFSPGGGQEVTQTTEQSQDISEGKFLLPTAIYLTIRF